MPEQERPAPSARGLAELVLVRHGQSLGNVADQAARDAEADRLDLEARDADVELSETGKEQAQALGRWVARLPEDRRPTVVLSSPYRRARMTAERALAGLDAEILLDERLRERDLGAFDGLTWRGIEREYPLDSARRAKVGKFYFRPPGGESWCDVALRVRQVLFETEARYPGARVWVFSHQAVIMSFRVAVEGLGEEDVLGIDRSTPLANCSMTSYRAGGQGRLELVAYGDTSALEHRDGADVTHEQTHGGQGDIADDAVDDAAGDASAGEASAGEAARTQGPAAGGAA